MSRISKPSRKLLESLDKGSSDSSSNSEFTDSELSSKSSDTTQIPTSKLRNEDDLASSGEDSDRDQPSPKRHKGLGGIVLKEKKTRGPGKKNKTAGKLACMRRIGQDSSSFNDAAYSPS